MQRLIKNTGKFRTPKTNVSIGKRMKKDIKKIPTAAIFLAAIVMVLSMMFSPMTFAKDAKKPNIVFILVDNWGWGDISIQGGKTSTP